MNVDTHEVSRLYVAIGAAVILPALLARVATAGPESNES